MTVAEHEGVESGPAVVLVVEDDADCRETMCETLRDAGYAVRAAVDGEEALRLLTADDATDPDVIVLDLWLPGMSGRDVLKVLKGHPRLSQLPIVLTSAGYPCGADTEPETEWLPKPFDAQHLLAAVSAHEAVRASRIRLQS
jgi:CheY-like chemotaxis protein